MTPALALLNVMSKPPPPWIVERFSRIALPPIESPPKELACRVIVPRPDKITVPLDERFKPVEPNCTGAAMIICPLFVMEEPLMLRPLFVFDGVGNVRLSELPTARPATPSATSNKTAAPDV